jgi:hypothetical protein
MHYFVTYNLEGNIREGPLINIHSRIPPQIFERKKIETALMGLSGARGTLIHEKNLKLKISCQTPFGKLSL